VLTDEVHKVDGKLNSDDNTLGRALNDIRQGSGPWTGPLDKIASLTNEVRNGEDAAGRELNDAAFHSDLRLTQTHANSLMNEVNAGKGGLGMLKNDPKFANKLTDTIAKTNALVAVAGGNGAGSLGKLTAADGMASLTGLESESKALAAMIRKDPKKYLTIELRIF
jgi:hypothetical protein